VQLAVLSVLQVMPQVAAKCHLASTRLPVLTSNRRWSSQIHGMRAWWRLQIAKRYA
jgi:hypothetical protein